MAGLQTATSRAEYFTTINELQSKSEQLLICLSANVYEGIGNVNVLNWAAHKALPYIAAGLNPNCSLMLPSRFQQAPRSTNAVEQSANKSYSGGRRLPLLPAIEWGRNIDKRDCEQYRNRNAFEVHHSYRSDNHSNQLFVQEGRNRMQSITDMFEGY